MCNMGPETEPFTHQRKVQNIGNTISQTDKQLAGTHKNSKKHIYEQHGLHKNLDPVEMNRQCKYPVYFLVATTSGFIQVACSRVQPRKVTIEKKDKINEYQKKRKRQKERTSVPRPSSWNIYVKKQCRHINRAEYNNVCELID